jgi:hypothetical protein
MLDNPLKILVLSTFDGRNANVIRDFLFSFNAYSKHKYYYIFDCKILDKNTYFSCFDVILIFWSLYLPGSSLSEEARVKISKSTALKMLFLQDEYRDVRAFNEIMRHLNIQVMFTCVAERDHEIFYPPNLIPSLQATHTVLTGYVPPYLEKTRFETQNHRPLDISYRSRVVPYYLGDLAREKQIVAERFQEISTEYGFKSDISVREQDRIYGNRWVKFMKSSRFVLGTPSGASVIDFTGDILRNSEKYLQRKPDATYEEVKQIYFADVDGKIVIDTVSPRIFETTALGCTMVMHEGEYGGILKAGEHYISVKKDYSNINDVVTQMRDGKHCSQLAKNAYRDLVASEKYSYRSFIRRFDNILAEHRSSSIQVQGTSKPAFYLRNYLKYYQGIVPYHGKFWFIPFALRIQKVGEIKNTVTKLLPLIKMPNLRRLSFKYFQNRVWKDVPPKAFFMDIVRLVFLHQLGTNKIQLTTPLGLEMNFDADSGKASFKSYPILRSDLNDSERTDIICPHPKMPKPEDLLEIIEWEYSGVGDSLVYYWKQTKVELFINRREYYGFEALSIILRKFPQQALPILEELLAC